MAAMGQSGDRSGQAVAVIIFFLSLSTVAVALRCYCRIRVVKSFGWEDWLAIMAHVFFVASCSCYVVGTGYGVGKHIWLIPPADVPLALKWWWACEPLYAAANMILKMSIGLFLIHIAVDRYHKAIILTVIVVTEVFGAVYFFLFIFQCQPVSYFWTKFEGKGATGKCYPEIIVVATYVYSSISCWGDWTMSIVPIFMIRRLQLTLRTKLAVIGILGLGGIASTATIIRFPYVHTMAGSTDDFLFTITDVAIWSTAETGLGITASAFITLRPLFRKVLGLGSSGNHPSGPTGRSGFARAKSTNPRSIFRSHPNEFRLSSDLGRQSGLTTIIKSGGDSGANAGRKGKNGTIWNSNATWDTSESQLACDEEMGHSSSIGSTGPEREHELRIEVNRTVVVQSSVFNSPAEAEASGELRYAGVSQSPAKVHD